MPVRRSTGRSDEPTDELGYEIVVLGCSWGGLAAVRQILAGLPADFAIVCEIEDKQPIEPGRFFLAPANYHMLIERGSFALSLEAPVRYSRPSIDVSMSTAADAYGHRAVGVVLTGANDDGAEGLRRIADSGGLPVVQDPASAEVPTMPRAALDAVPKARVFPLDRIGAFLAALPAASHTGTA
jgi:two-component system chemotaxis response regulator CheB